MPRRPKLKRLAVGVGALSAGVAALALPGAGAAAGGSARADRAVQSALLAGLNAVRAERGLSQLRPNRALERAAMSHDREMLQFGFFGHSSYRGQAFWQRVERWYPPRGRGWTVGENLLAASPSVSAASTLSHWLASPVHRAVLYNPSWVSVGIAVVHVPSAGGIYAGEATTVITADFGRPG
jgi:uncharacterized protein YkwD